MNRQDAQWWVLLTLLVAVFVVPVYGAFAQEALSPEVTTDTRIHVAGPDLLFLDGVTMGGQPYAVYLAADHDGIWRVTAVEPINHRTLPEDVNLGMVELSTPASGELLIKNVYLDGEFYSGIVAFDPSFQQVRAYEFSATPPPDHRQPSLVAQSSQSRAPSPSTDQGAILQRLDEYAAQGARRLDRLEAHIEALTQRVDATAESGAVAVSALMNRVAESSGVAADEVAPTLSLARARSQMASIDTLDLTAGIPVTGSWRALDSHRVAQTDPDARFAKLLLPYRQDSRPRLYRVLTRASGEGWAGVGIHLGVTDVELPAGYGHGRSILVWLTRDVQVYGNDTTFLEIYVSYDDVTMNRVAQSALNSDLSTTSALEVLMDPGAGMLTVAVNGVEQFRYRVSVPQGAGLELALRALGRGEFSDLEVRRR